MVHRYWVIHWAVTYFSPVLLLPFAFFLLSSFEAVWILFCVKCIALTLLWIWRRECLVWTLYKSKLSTSPNEKHNVNCRSWNSLRFQTPVVLLIHDKYSRWSWSPLRCQKCVLIVNIQRCRPIIGGWPSFSRCFLGCWSTEGEQIQLDYRSR